jgi:two-component system, NtrC family, sensor kinase
VKLPRFTATLKTKLVVLFLVFALVPLAIIGFFSVRITENLIVNLVFRQLENVAADKAVIIERWLVERKADLNVIAGTSIIKTMDPAAIASYLNLIQHHYGVYKEITVADHSGAIVFSTNTISSINGNNEEWSRTTTQTPLFKAGVTYHPNETESTFHITVPILDGENVKGTVYGTVGTANIINSILNVSLGETGECYLVDKSGTFLAHKEPHRILTDNIYHSESFKKIFEERDRKKTYLDYRGVEVSGASRNVGGTDWYIVVEQDRDEAYLSATVLKRSIVFTIALCILSASLLTFIISYHVIRPIHALSKSANVIAQCQFPADKLETNRRDEIGMLYHAFKDMAQRVCERHTSLEKKVTLQDVELKDTDIILKQIKLIAERSEKFAAIGRLGASIAHDIRTPLTSLKLFLESVQAEIEISQEYEEDYSVAMSQIRRIETAINRFLEFSKPQQLNITTIDVAKLVEETVSMIRPMAIKQECLLNVTLQNDLPHIEGDKQFLEEALVNLLINSLEAMSDQGLMVVTAKIDRFLFNGQHEPCIRIDIRDTGPGITDEHIDMIFDPFFTTKPTGTGLGLPLVLNTIQRHGGAVRVCNQESGGALFSIFLPSKKNTELIHG